MKQLSSKHQTKEQLVNELFQQVKTLDLYVREIEAYNSKQRAIFELELYNQKQDINALKIRIARHEKKENAHRI